MKEGNFTPPPIGMSGNRLTKNMGRGREDGENPSLAEPKHN